MIDDEVGHELLDRYIASELVGNESGFGNLHVIAHELSEALGIQLSLVHMLCNDLAATLNDAYYWSLRGSAAALVRASTLAWFSADIALVHFHDARQKFALLKHGVTNPHSHVPSRVFVHFQITRKLTGRDAFFGIQYQRDSQEPFLQRQVGVMEDCVNCDAEGRIATIAMMPGLARHRGCTSGFAVRTNRLPVPSDAFNMGDAISFGGELFVDGDYVHGYPLLGHHEYTPGVKSCQEKSTTVN